MTIYSLGSLSYKQAQTSDALGIRRRRKMMSLQKYKQEPTEGQLHQNLNVKLQRRGLERLKNKNLKV